MYNRYKLVAFFLLLLLGVIPLAAATVSGFVGDGSTGAALPGANIVIENSQRGTISNTEGHFAITLDPGTYTISASYIGYHITKKNVTVTNRTNTVTFELTPLILAGQTVSVTVNRARERETPVSFSNITQKDIAQRYYAQDVPMVLTEVPGVYAYSDAGNGLGYTYLKVRGFDQKRVQVMLNGIPLNDPEDHQVYWVDMPDFMASVQDIQIQRGVGSSLSGSSAFGGSVNVQTHELNTPQKILVTTGTGSYNTRKFSLNLHSGLINNT
ncbi:TonB-dependent receptor, partial [bacterium]|nr:TonB-dependent receptor [bacterium]